MVDVFEFSDRMNCRVLAVFGTREALKSDPMSVPKIGCTVSSDAHFISSSRSCMGRSRQLGLKGTAQTRCIPGMSAKLTQRLHKTIILQF